MLAPEMVLHTKHVLKSRDGANRKEKGITGMVAGRGIKKNACIGEAKA